LVSKNGNIKETQIKSKEILAIQNSDIKVFKNRETFTVAIQKGEVSQTFAVNNTEYNDIKTTVSDSKTGEDVKE
jgi:hypothetical protein